jgi:uncharacterized membrane protein
MKKINRNWSNNLLPWYVILKNLFAIPFMLVAVLFGAAYITCMCAYIAFMGISYLIVKGRSYAEEWVKDELFGVY